MVSPTSKELAMCFPHTSDMETQIFLSKNLNSASQDQQKTHKRANGSFNKDYHVSKNIESRAVYLLVMFSFLKSVKRQAKM